MERADRSDRARFERILDHAPGLSADLAALYDSWPENFVPEEAALRSDLSGMRIFDTPLFGISSAADPLYEQLKREGVIGPWHRSPGEWLPGARRVISLFFPFTEQVRKAQRAETEEVSPEWLHGRIEGHDAMLVFAARLKDQIEESGYDAMIPVTEEAFSSVKGGCGLPGYPSMTEATFGSNWSERHAAYISGLGTFGLSGGLITRRGMAGRFCSIITNRLFPVTERSYTRYDEWCIRCGACARRCPVEAISLENGKDHIRCHAQIDASRIRYAPRYGCGHCQTGVPCEDRRCLSQDIR